MARHADDFPNDPVLVLANPEDEVTPQLFLAWLDRIQHGEPQHVEVSAAETLAEIR